MSPLLTMLALLGTAGSALAVDHGHALFDEVLGKFVEDGLVDYAGLQRSGANVDSDFSRYLAELAEGSEGEWSDDQRLAYWINAYNAFTLKLIVDHYPIRPRWYMKALPFLRAFLPTNSILMVKGRWDGVEFISVRGPITLGDIEHEILRPEFQDPRIHFAIVCASIGCPDLRPRGFHPERVQEELEDATERFVTDPDKVRLAAGDNDLRVSKIFAWFRRDFERSPDREVPADVPFEKYGEDSEVVRWLAAYGSPRLDERLRAGPFELGHVDYDWTLNEQGRPEP